MRVSIVGMGWYGKPLAEKLALNHTVSGTKSSREGVKNLKLNAVKIHYLNLNEALDYAALTDVFNVDALVLNIPPSGNSIRGYRDKMKKILTGMHAYNPAHLIFISSTGVFGEHQHLADEDTTPVPGSGNGEVLAAAELYLAENFKGKYSVIRPAGLVGGERHPAKYLAGRRHVSGKNNPVNLVHRDDLIALTEFLIENNIDRSYFHAVASLHPSKKEFYTAAAEKLGLEKPEFDEADLSEGKLILGKITQEETIPFKFNDPFKMA